MKKMLKVALTLMLSLGVFTSITSSQVQLIQAKEDLNKYDWVNEFGKYTLIDNNGNLVKGWHKDDANCWYFLDYQTGVMKTGWVASDSTTWYYLGGSGVMQSGWQEIDGNKYYFETSGKQAGAMRTGTIELNGEYFDLGTDGIYKGKTNEFGMVETANRGKPLYSGYEKLDTQIRAILDEIIKPGMSETEELKAIHDWICNNISYGQLSGKTDGLGTLADGLIEVEDFSNINKSEMVYSIVTGVLHDKKGVCDWYSLLFNTLSDARGFKTGLQTGNYNNGTNITGHAWSVVWFDGEWKIMDVQLDDYKDDGSILNIGFMVDPDSDVANNWLIKKEFDYHGTMTPFEEACTKFDFDGYGISKDIYIQKFHYTGKALNK